MLCIQKSACAFKIYPPTGEGLASEATQGWIGFEARRLGYLVQLGFASPHGRNWEQQGGTVVHTATRHSQMGTAGPSLRGPKSIGPWELGGEMGVQVPRPWHTLHAGQGTGIPFQTFQRFSCFNAPCRARAWQPVECTCTEAPQPRPLRRTSALSCTPCGAAQFMPCVSPEIQPSRASAGPATLNPR